MGGLCPGPDGWHSTDSLVDVCPSPVAIRSSRPFLTYASEPAACEEGEGGGDVPGQLPDTSE